MPESKGREQAKQKKKAARRADAAKAQAENKRALVNTRAWVVPTFATCGLLGVLWLVVWYITTSTGVTVPGMSDLGNWNMAIGMGLIAAAFGIATLWK